MSAPPAPPLLLASTSPQRRAILEQLGIPFHAVAPQYEEDDQRDAMPSSSCASTRGGRRSRWRPERASVRCSASTPPSCSATTTYGKPADATDAERMLEALAGPTHVVVSGLCLLTPAWEVVEHDSTSVTFRPLTPRDLAVTSRTASGGSERAATRSRDAAARLVERIEGDYLNVVGLPAALLVRMLAERFPGVYGFG